MSEDEHADEQPVINAPPKNEKPRPVVNTSPLVPPMADSYRGARVRAWVDDVDARYLARQYAARHITRA